MLTLEHVQLILVVILAFIAVFADNWKVSRVAMFAVLLVIIWLAWTIPN